MKSILLFFTLVFLSFSNVSAQDCTPVFQKSYGGPGNDQALEIIFTNDKGSLLAGRSTSGTAGDFNGFLIKLTEEGNIQWSRSLGGDMYDDLARVKQTADNGYIAIGNTGLSDDARVWIVRAEANGNIKWIKHYNYQSSRLKAKDIIQLNNGDFVFAANINDSTEQGDGLICRLDASGNQMWSKVFDNGRDDGINYLMKDGSDVYATGYATGDFRDGILMKSNANDGSIIWTKRIIRQPGLHDEVLEVERINNGFAFSATSYSNEPAGLYSSTSLAFLKINEDGKIGFQRLDEYANTESGMAIELIRHKLTSDSGFVYILSDKGSLGYPGLIKISPTGIDEWGRSLSQRLRTYRMRALDKTGDKGFLIAGYANNYETGYKDKIVVYKTDELGKTGDCEQGATGALFEGTDYKINEFSWRKVQSVAIVISADLAQQAVEPNFSLLTSCSKLSCTDPPLTNDKCSASFLTHYSGTYSLVAYDAMRTSDAGYVTVGYNLLNRSCEPIIIKHKPGGDVEWAKTLNSFAHVSLFTRVLPAADGNMILIGINSYEANHVGTYSTILMKVTNSGQVLWSYNAYGTAYGAKEDENGGFIVCGKADGLSESYYAFRVDANGHKTWEKRIISPGRPTDQTILIDNGSVYIGSNYSNNIYHTVQIDRLDVLTGNPVWAKRFDVNNEVTEVESLHKIGDTLIVAVNLLGRINDFSNEHTNFGIVKIPETGEATGFKISNINFFMQQYGVYSFGNHKYFTNAVKTDGSNFVFAEQTLRNNDTVLNLTKVSSSGKVVWSKNYLNLKKEHISFIKEDAGTLLIVGKRDLGYSPVENQRKLEAFLMKVDAKGDIMENGSGNCENQPFNALTSAISIKNYPSINETYTDGNRVQLARVSPFDRKIDIKSRPSCALESTCNRIGLAGPSMSCGPGETLYYKVERNASCTLPVTWKVDPSSVTIVSQNDNSLSLQFNTEGSFQVVALIDGGCSILTDTINLTIHMKADSINLGPDTAICEGNTIALQAAEGFVSYLWQDGSTSAFFKVTGRGLFKVKVKDVCGGIYSDEINVKAVSSIPINLGEDRVKCNFDTVQMKAPSGFLRYYWYFKEGVSLSEEAVLVINPLSDTTLFIKAEKTTGCFAYDTIAIRVNHSKAIELGSDTSLCKGEHAILDAGTDFTSYTWSTGELVPQIKVDATGAYSVTAITDGGCRSYDTLRIKEVFENPVIDLPNDGALCIGSAREVSAGDHYRSYLWSDGNTTSSIKINNTGSYSVEVTDTNNCRARDSILVTSLLPLPFGFLTADTTICTYGSMKLEPDRAFKAYLWSNGSGGHAYTISNPGTYWLEVIDDNNCRGRDSILVTSKDCMKGFFAPNAFSPNGDGKNETFKPLLYGTLKVYQFTVFNRWGEIIFKTEDQMRAWDGKLAGRPQDSNIFIWVCRYQLEGGYLQTEKGTVMLLR